MARTLALLALTTSETAPGPTAAVPATVFTTAHMNNQLFRSLTGGNSVHSTALACCKVCSVGKACGNT
jgi:hypothetical protein